jgi:hypothetical protein
LERKAAFSASMNSSLDKLEVFGVELGRASDASTMALDSEKFMRPNV